MFDSPLAIVLAGYTGVCLVGFASCLVGAGIYGLKEAKIHHEIQAHPYTKLHNRRPLISIVVYASKERQSILKCLESIRHSSYQKYEIIVVADTQSSDQTIRADILSFTAKYPKSIVHLLRRRKKSRRLEAVAAGIKKWAHGELIMDLDADSTLDRQALRNACTHFISSTTALLIPNTRIRPEPSILGVLQQFDQLLRLSAKKLLSLLEINYGPGPSGTVYRRPDKLSRPKTASSSGKYANDVLIYTAAETSWFGLLRKNYQQKFETLQGLSRFKKSSASSHVRGLKTQRQRGLFAILLMQLLALLTPLVVSYLLYLAIYFKQSALYGISWIIFSIILLGIIWGSDYLALAKRLHLTAFIPITYALFYVMSFIQFLALTASAVKLKILLANHSKA